MPYICPYRIYTTLIQLELSAKYTYITTFLCWLCKIKSALIDTLSDLFTYISIYFNQFFGNNFFFGTTYNLHTTVSCGFEMIVEYFCDIMINAIIIWFPTYSEGCQIFGILTYVDLISSWLPNCTGLWVSPSCHHLYKEGCLASCKEYIIT